MGNPRHLRRSRATAVAGLAVVGALLLSSCSGGATSDASQGGSGDGVSEAAQAGQQSAEGRYGGNLVVRLPQDPGSLDSVVSSNAGTTYISRMIFEQLVTLNADREPTAVLAKDWKVSDNQQTFTFHLRDGLVFSDGTPLTAKDVAASLRYWVQNSSYADTVKGVLNKISTPNKTTVVIKLNAPFKLIPLLAAANSSQIHKAEAVKSAPETGIPKEKIIGSGPYKLKKWVAGQKIVLERNDKYQPPKGKASGYAGHMHAYLDTVTYKVIKSPDAALNALKTGTVDVSKPTSAQYQTVKNDPNLNIGVQASGSIVYVAPNHNPESVMSNPKVRNAFNLAIDKKAIIAAQGLPDLVSPNNGAFSAPSNEIMYSEAGKDKYQSYNPEKAKQMFAEAGVDSITMTTTGEFPRFKDALVLIQQDLKEIGVEAKITSYDFATMLSKSEDPTTWDVLALMGTATPPIPMYTDNVNGLSTEGYDPEGLQPLVDAYRRTSTPEAAAAAVDDIQAFTAKHLPTIPLYLAKQYVAYSDRVGGYEGWEIFFADTWVKD